jgi:hypothetical protein
MLQPNHIGAEAQPDTLLIKSPDCHASKGYVGHQFSDALERPFLHLLFFSRRPRWAKDRVALTSRFSLSRATGGSPASSEFLSGRGNISRRIVSVGLTGAIGRSVCIGTEYL